MQFEPRFDIYALFMLLGFFQGVFLAYFFFSRRKQKESNIIWGALILSIALAGSEILLNYTGLIVKVLFIENYSEPLVFIFAPLAFLGFKTELNQKLDKQDWIHIFPFVFYLLYCTFYFIQPDEVKYNSYVYCYQPDWNYIDFASSIPNDLLGIRSSLTQLYISQFVIYGILIYQLLMRSKHEFNNSTKSSQKKFKNLKIHWFHYIFIAVLILVVKISFDRDLGDYIIGSYLSMIIYASSFIILAKPNRTVNENTILDGEKAKYSKSSLTNDNKLEIYEKLLKLFEEEKIYLQSGISLNDLSNQIHSPVHHISQVINEKMGKPFFEVLSEFRIQEAEKILSNPTNNNLTIEDVAEQVGYNSKAAFNKAFKKITGLTPSAIRKAN